MDGNESNKLVKGALLLTLAGLISKVLSAGYRIPLQNLTGDIGFYIYQQVYPILGMALVLSLYGFPSAISKMMADLKVQGINPSLRNFYVPIFSILCCINGALFIFLLFNADFIAVWVGDENLKGIYRFAAFLFLFIPFSAVLRGGLQGNNYMKPTAYSQVGEQLARVCIIIFAAVFISVQGERLYSVGQAAVVASILGAITAILILSLFFIKNKPYTNDLSTIPWNYYVRTLLTLGIVAALNHMVLLAIQFADAFTLVPSLREYGLSQLESMEAKGVFDRGQPLIQLGTVIGSSFALALIPTISREKLQRDHETIYHYIRSALHFSLYLAIGATIGLILIFPEANTLLFENGKGTTSLRILVMAILLCSVAITGASILQGLGYIKRTAAFILIAIFVKWILNQLIVPFLGITGGALATVLSLLVLSILVILELERKLPGLRYLEQIKWRSLFIACGTMTIYIWVMDHLFSIANLSSRIELLVYVMFIAITGAAVYILLLIKCGAFSERELSMLPFAAFFIRLHRGRNKK
ncbi:putative polysaccharide biosynthesis protein [Virgibacillus oceani]|uniref:Membrane protein YabM n=1 Tax=Virgibacillus oceani TaxID=1479511 RepID=A0A917HJW7_9BACI|nr:oligosaccharide flippase family protein [Virgibacillus oceani]GGG82058.1 putative membrane protein YabM [Virgibacillus oceani]